MAEYTDIAELCDQGRYQDAYKMARRLGPLRKWVGQEPRLLAGRLASLLGGGRLAVVLRYLGWRDDREARSGQLAYASTLVNHRSPYAAWKFLPSYGKPR